MGDTTPQGLAAEIKAYLAEGWSGPRDAKLLAKAADALSKAETQGLSHALLLNAYRGYADQMQAMAERIRELDAEVAELRGQREPGSACICNGGWSVDENYQPEDYEAGEPLRPEKGLIPCGLCNHGGWDAPWPQTAGTP